MNKLILAAALTCCGVLVTTGCAVNSGQSTVGQYVDDATITTRVKTRIAEDPRVSAMRIGVETLNGTVQLSGFATTQSEKDQAAAVARAVPDVKDVRNSIVVRPAQP
jgi:hyperosmotically inducible periplasmic protein